MSDRRRNEYFEMIDVLMAASSDGVPYDLEIVAAAREHGYDPEVVYTDICHIVAMICDANVIRGEQEMIRLAKKYTPIHAAFLRKWAR